MLTWDALRLTSRFFLFTFCYVASFECRLQLEHRLVLDVFVVHNDGWCPVTWLSVKLMGLVQLYRQLWKPCLRPMQFLQGKWVSWREGLALLLVVPEVSLWEPLRRYAWFARKRCVEIVHSSFILNF